MGDNTIAKLTSRLHQLSHCISNYDEPVAHDIIIDSLLLAAISVDQNERCRDTCKESYVLLLIDTYNHPFLRHIRRIAVQNLTEAECDPESEIFRGSIKRTVMEYFSRLLPGVDLDAHRLVVRAFGNVAHLASLYPPTRLCSCHNARYSNEHGLDIVPPRRNAWRPGFPERKHDITLFTTLFSSLDVFSEFVNVEDRATAERKLAANLDIALKDPCCSYVIVPPWHPEIKGCSKSMDEVPLREHIPKAQTGRMSTPQNIVDKAKTPSIGPSIAKGQAEQRSSRTMDKKTKSSKSRSEVIKVDKRERADKQVSRPSAPSSRNQSTAKSRDANGVSIAAKQVGKKLPVSEDDRTTRLHNTTSAGPTRSCLQPPWGFEADVQVRGAGSLRPRANSFSARDCSPSSETRLTASERFGSPFDKGFSPITEVDDPDITLVDDDWSDGML